MLRSDPRLSGDFTAHKVMLHATPDLITYILPSPLKGNDCPFCAHNGGIGDQNFLFTLALEYLRYDKLL